MNPLKLINQILEFRRTKTKNEKNYVSRDNIVTQVLKIGLKYDTPSEYLKKIERMFPKRKDHK